MVVVALRMYDRHIHSNGPNDKEPYDLSSLYWHVFAARLAFVVAFEVGNWVRPVRSAMFVTAV